MATTTATEREQMLRLALDQAGFLLMKKGYVLNGDTCTMHYLPIVYAFINEGKYSVAEVVARACIECDPNYDENS